MPDIELLTAPPPIPFACPTCDARYILVRAEADAVSGSEHVMCRRCGGSLNGREIEKPSPPTSPPAMPFATTPSNTRRRASLWRKRSTVTVVYRDGGIDQIAAKRS
jgi:hypothetical protein